LGYAVALLVYFRRFDALIWGTIAFACSFVGGIALTAGWWMWRLWRMFGNPLMPYMNDFFRSPMVAELAFKDQRFLPNSVLEYALWPIVTAIHPTRVMEVGFTDVRFAIIYIISLVLLMQLLSGRRGYATKLYDWAIHRNADVLVAFFVSSYVIWMITFSIYRYIVALELIAPLCAVVLFGRVRLAPKVQIPAVFLILSLMLLAFQPAEHRSRKDWTYTTPWFRFGSMPFDLGDAALIVMLGEGGISYAIPAFPASARFVRPDGNLLLRTENGFHREIKASISRQIGSLYVMFSRWEVDAGRLAPHSRANNLGIDFNFDSCRALSDNAASGVILCPAWRSEN
jgi:hypothetical protein